MSDLKIGDPVKVNDPGLAMLAQFAPEGAKPNNYGFVSEICDDGQVLVEFPVGDDDMREHSQVAPYPIGLVQKRSPTE